VSLVKREEHENSSQSFPRKEGSEGAKKPKEMSGGDKARNEQQECAKAGSDPDPTLLIYQYQGKSENDREILNAPLIRDSGGAKMWKQKDGEGKVRPQG